MMIRYAMKKMYRHLANLVFIDSTMTLLVRFGKPSQAVKGYDMKLVNISTNDALVSAAIIGTSFAVLSVLLVYLTQHGINVWVIVAALFISFGTGRQIIAISLDTVTTSMDDFISSWASIIHLVAKNGRTPEWQSIENQVETIFTYNELERKLPAEFKAAEPDSPQIYKYIDEHKWELGYQPGVTPENHISLAFAQHAINQLMERLEKYDRLQDAQKKGGGANTVILIAIGTLIWLMA